MQHHDSKLVPLNKIRHYFDKIIQTHPEIEEFLAKDGPNVHNEKFESAISKIQTAVAKQEDTVRLTPAEKEAVVIFLKSDDGSCSGDDSDSSLEESFLKDADDEFELRVLKKSKKEFPYVDTSHVSATSVIVEQLFSRCGIIMRPHRRLMDPYTLELLVMLRFNRDLWNEEEVERAMKGDPLPPPISVSSTPVSNVTASSSSLR